MSQKKHLTNLIHSLMEKDYASAKEFLTLAVEAKMKERIGSVKSKKDKEDVKVSKKDAKSKKDTKATKKDDKKKDFFKKFKKKEK